MDAQRTPDALSSQPLYEALKWLLENQVYVSGHRFIEAGCGCCSSEVEVPPDIAKTINEVMS